MLHRTFKSLLVTGIAIAGLGAFAGTAAADTDPQSTWEPSYKSWNDPDDKGGISTSQKMQRLNDRNSVRADFHAYGEILKIRDSHRNGRSAIARVWVGGSGPAVYYGNGDGTTRTVTDLSYDEGQTVYVQVCTSDSANAMCTTAKKNPGRT